MKKVGAGEGSVIGPIIEIEKPKEPEQTEEKEEK